MSETPDPIPVLQLLTQNIVGGSETLALTLATASVHPRFRYHFCTLLPEGPLHATIREAGFECRSLDTRYNLPTAAIRLTRLLSELRIRLVHVYGLRTDLMTRMLVRLGDRPLVSAVHSVYEHPGLARRLIERNTAGRVNLFLSNSRRGADHFRARTGVTPERIVVVHPGIESSSALEGGQSNDIRQTVGATQNSVVVTLAARMKREKGHLLLLEAVAAVRARRPEADVRVLFVGRDASEGAVAQAVENSGIKEITTPLGYVAKGGMPEVYRASDILALPSYREGLPTVILEAMAAGLPVVATNVGGTSEAIREGETGFVVPPDDATALADRLERLIIDSELRQRLGAAGRAWAEEKWTAASMARGIEGHYERLLSR